MTKPGSPEWVREVVQEHGAPKAYGIIFCDPVWENGMRVLVPSHMWPSTFDYILYGTLHSCFLEAVFSDQLLQSFGRADDVNRMVMEDWVKFLWNYTPTECHGGPDRVKRWCEIGGYLGVLQKREEASS